MSSDRPRAITPLYGGSRVLDQLWEWDDAARM